MLQFKKSMPEVLVVKFIDIKQGLDLSASNLSFNHKHHVNADWMDLIFLERN